MHETVILKTASNLRIPQFLGTFPVDRLPTPNYSDNVSFILNHDIMNGPGIHWVAVILSKNNNVEYYDSLGNPPPHELYTWKSNISYNRKPTQSMFADTCGEHSLYYLYLRLVVGFSQSETLNQLYEKRNADSYVKKFISKYRY